MVFSSLFFLFYFLPAFLALYYVLPWKNQVLLLASLVFYGWAEPVYLPLLALSAALNFAVGLAIARLGHWRRPILAAGIVANLAILFYYKYLGFFLHDVLGLPLAGGSPALPLGISFFTFQGLSYIADVYRREVAPQASFLKFFTYKAMFPQLIAGPIVRYRDIASEIGARTLGNAQVREGFEQFALGLAQKVLIANVLAKPADRLLAVELASLPAATAWLGLVCYTLQIFYDFCGYSNMAIGMGKMTGFNYPINFRQPYSSRSVTEFWRRWHISLSSWFRDYVYIPLGGSRHGQLRTLTNLATVFLLCGLWHGASWTFVVWGLWHGAALVLERVGLGRVLQAVPAFLAWAWTMLVVMAGWVFFRADSLPDAIGYFVALGGMAEVKLPHPWQVEMGMPELAVLALAIACATLRIPVRIPVPARLPLAVLALAASALSLAAGSYNPFIYYRF
jgi:alginate O-acetyltransferase complex protein AlgI